MVHVSGHIFYHIAKVTKFKSQGIPGAREVVVVGSVLLLAVLMRLAVVSLVTAMLLAFVLLLVVVVALVTLMIMLQW